MRRLNLALTAACIFAAPAFANVIIVDGDTLRIDDETIRIVEIDTPETFRSRCENELILGLKAKERLRALVDSGAVSYEPTGTDRYGRILARLFVQQEHRRINIGETLITDGHALRYHSGSEAKIARLRVWCGPHAELGDTWKH
ncbi:MAG TPA: thermonuclease family protein [Pseudaminobacter sp.]|nr:thermonuclease family protein [Pseudaminobacter sp.]